MERDLSVRDVLTREYVAVSEADTVEDAVGLMRSERVGCVLVVRGSEPVGIMTEWDVLGLVEGGDDPEGTTVDELMSTPLLTIGADRSLREAASTMTSQNVRNLVVENDEGIAGVLTQRDVIAAAGTFSETTRTNAVEDEPTMADASETVVANGGDEFDTQGVCEGCGTLTDALWEIDGKLLCADCESV